MCDILMRSVICAGKLNRREGRQYFYLKNKSSSCVRTLPNPNGILCRALFSPCQSDAKTDAGNQNNFLVIGNMFSFDIIVDDSLMAEVMCCINLV